MPDEMKEKKSWKNQLKLKKQYEENYKMYYKKELDAGGQQIY